MESLENPYAPPLVAGNGIPAAPPPFGWEIDGKIVRVRRTSRLPMIDPYTGNSGESMMLQNLAIRHRPLWLWAFPVAGAWTGLCFFQGGGHTAELVASAVSGSVIGWLLSLPIRVFLSTCAIHVFFEKRTLRNRRMTSNVMNLLFLTGIFSAFARPYLPFWLEWLPSGAFLTWSVTVIFVLLFRRCLHCHRVSGGVFEIRGFHPLALKTLAGEPSTYS